MMISLCPLIDNNMLNVNENSSWMLCSSASFRATYLLRKRRIDKYNFAEFVIFQTFTREQMIKHKVTTPPIFLQAASCIAYICHNRHNRRWCIFVELFSIENAKFWPFLAYFDYSYMFYIFIGYFVANLHTFWCTLYRPR